MGLLLAGCASAASPAPTTTPLPSASPATTASPRPPSAPPTIEPTGTPIAAIDHATGPNDVVLRFDSGGDYDYGICELCGGWGEFTPGPEFTLYGDGTVIVRNGQVQPPPAEGPIVRAQPFRTAHLDEEQVQSLLGFAIGEGGLGSALELYNTRTDTDETGSAVFTIRAGGLDKTVVIDGNANPFAVLRDHLLDTAQRSDVATSVWVPERYWGLLIEMSSWIEHGVLPAPDDAAIVPWPWRGIEPKDFVGPGALSAGRRSMTTREAAVLGLSDNGGVVQQVFVREPDGDTIYSFSLWPMLPDETG